MPIKHFGLGPEVFGEVEPAEPFVFIRGGHPVSGLFFHDRTHIGFGQVSALHFRRAQTDRRPRDVFVPGHARRQMLGGNRLGVVDGSQSRTECGDGGGRAQPL